MHADNAPDTPTAASVMDDEGDRNDVRPGTAVKILRTIPGSFNDDIISPFKENSRPSRLHANAPPSSALENMPSLAPPARTPAPNSTDTDSPSVNSRLFDTQAEIAVREHLQDIESSFAAPLSPLPNSSNGADDAYRFDSPSKKPPDREHAQQPKFPVVQQEAYAHSLSVLNDGNESQLPDVGMDFMTEHKQNTSTASLEIFSSSPTAAAAARTISRAISRASASASTSQRETEHTELEQGERHDSGHQEGDVPSVPEPPSEVSSRAASSVRGPDSRGSESNENIYGSAADAGSSPGHALKAGQRPKYLRSRNGSQRSSNSSVIFDHQSDVTIGLGTDYALQSGGAVPALGTPANMSGILSRSISMGSMASGIEDYHNARHLQALGEVDSNSMSTGRTSRVPDEESLKTPKAKSHSTSLAAPTDTVIARHVRNVQVPESLAREYKTKSGLETPRNPSSLSESRGFGTTNASRHGGKNLTLKEQSSTIERLSKENFDLKLKVMFLSDRLDKLSEEGVKEMISENVELKTGLAVLQRDNKALRRRIKELEKQLKDEEERPGTAKSGQSDDAQSAAYDHEAQEREEEVVYLREKVEEHVTEIERLRTENMQKEAEKRRMAEVVKTLGERAGERYGDSFDRQEEADVWKDLLEQETARREQGDEDNRRLREEIFRLKQDMSNHPSTPGAGLHHTTNIYNITKKARDQPSGPSSRPPTAYSNECEVNGTSASVSSTLVEDLRRESEQLRHENAELRREVGAQTSMLTSRNREKERLYQEIEDLKMAQRRGGPASSTVDSLLDRSASRNGAHERTISGASGRTRVADTIVDDSEREELEAKMGELRDKNSELRLRCQELQRELDACMTDFETAVEAKKQAEELAAALQEDVDTAMTDLMALQAERDEAVQDHANLEHEFEALRKEAQEEIDALEGEADQRSGEIERLQIEVNDRTENFDALQEEMRKMSDALVGLEDEQENKIRKIQQLEKELADANKELEELETKLLEVNDKAQRLSVQQESSQGEIAFLREEQEGDKIRIGDLEAALANAEHSIRDERDRTRELEQRLADERRQREIVADKEKEEVQQFVNELNREVSTAKDENRRLRKSLTSKEVETAEWKERLLELESNLREVLGDLNGTRSSLLKSIAKLQRDLENTSRDLDSTKASLMEKDHIIKQRDALLESHGLESRKLAEMLDKERQAHRTTKAQFETFQKTHQHVTRTVTSQDSRILELETAKAQDKKRLAQLEVNFKEQLTERNNLLLILWTRLSAICGTDWAHDNSLINGRALPSLESVATMLPGFSKNLLAAVKTIENMMCGFQGKVKNVEKVLWGEYQTLEYHLEQRTRKLERLESVVRGGISSGTWGGHGSDRVKRLEEAYRQLKVENHTLRTAAEVRARAGYAAPGEHGEKNLEGGGSPSSAVPRGPYDRSRIPTSGSRGRMPLRSSTAAGAAPSHSQLERTTSRLSSSTGHLSPAAAASDSEESGGTPGAVDSGGSGTVDTAWVLRLRDLEHKMTSEREARKLDRREAMKRINEIETENSLLRENLERERKRQQR